MERVILIRVAKVLAQVVSAGKTKCIGVSDPNVGNQSNRSEKNSINIRPSQKGGIEIKTKAETVYAIYDGILFYG